MIVTQSSDVLRWAAILLGSAFLVYRTCFMPDSPVNSTLLYGSLGVGGLWLLRGRFKIAAVVVGAWFLAPYLIGYFELILLMIIPGLLVSCYCAHSPGKGKKSGKK